MKCIYVCPTKALSPGIFKFAVLKDGYNLQEMSEEAKSQSAMDDKLSPNVLWQGVIDYLEKDGPGG